MTLETSPQKRRSQERRRYLGADSLPQFRNYLRRLRRFVLMEERAYELARLGCDDMAELRHSNAKDITTMFDALRPGTLFGDLLLVAARPPVYEDTDERVRQFVEHFLVVTGTTPLAERVAEFKRELARLRVPRVTGWPGAEARLAAAERIVDGIGHAIHPSRWPLVKPVLDELTEQHHSEPGAELRQTLLSALFEALEVVGECTLAEEDEVRRKLRARLNALATGDLAGPNWRRVGKDIPLDDEEIDDTPDELETDESPSQAEKAEARLSVERLMADAGLTRTEAEVVKMVADRGGDHGAITAVAHDLGKNRSTVGVQYC